MTIEDSGGFRRRPPFAPGEPPVEYRTAVLLTTDGPEGLPYPIKASAPNVYNAYVLGDLSFTETPGQQTLQSATQTKQVRFFNLSGDNYLEQGTVVFARKRYGQWWAERIVNSGSLEQTAGGRLSLDANSPVNNAGAKVAGSDYLYYLPFVHDEITLYDGNKWKKFHIPAAGVQALLPGLSTPNIYDVFAFDNAGTLALNYEVWTDATTRNASLAAQDGVLVKQTDHTKRFLGTIDAVVSATGGGTWFDDALEHRGVWNEYNRVWRSLQRPISGWSITEDIPEAREHNNGADGEDGRLFWIDGSGYPIEDYVLLTLTGRIIEDVDSPCLPVVGLSVDNGAFVAASAKYRSAGTHSHGESGGGNTDPAEVFPPYPFTIIGTGHGLGRMTLTVTEATTGGAPSSSASVEGLGADLTLWANVLIRA